MDKKKFFFNLLYVVLIIAVILFMVWIVRWTSTESLSCLADPIKYYTEKTADQCMCFGSNFGITP